MPCAVFASVIVPIVPCLKKQRSHCGRARGKDRYTIPQCPSSVIARDRAGNFLWSKYFRRAGELFAHIPEWAMQSGILHRDGLYIMEGIGG
jgi:hypothetical protein